MPREIAIYGKGGIGKSTLAANIPAAIADRGRRVLQIGCDPKHDSTRLLMHGARIDTVLDYIKSTNPLDYHLEDILFTGYHGIGCIESGGPEPGVGCAGRGIITAFKLLDQFHVKDSYDVVVYDVLGDVVCGGFAVPVRREYADTIFLVTSGEFMSLYAANNILRGIRNYDKGNKRVAGILFNARGLRDEDERVKAFSEAVGLPIITKIPRDNIFEKAEREGCTLSEMNTPESADILERIRGIAELILSDPELYDAAPLSDEELEEVVMGTVAKVATESARKTPESLATSGGVAALKASPDDARKRHGDGYLSKNVVRDEPLHGCAFNGAMTMSVHLSDAVIIAHGPKSCTYISYQGISSSGRRRLFERGTLLPVAIAPNIVSTDMDESNMVFGGTGKLLDLVQQIIDRDEADRPRAIVIVSTCAAGIIGDDIDDAKALSTSELPIITVKADGNLSGDYMQGMLDSYTQLARQVVDPNVPVRRKTVNIVFEKVITKNTESNFSTISGFLNAMGVTVNCRFLYHTTFDALRDFCSAELNLLAYADYSGRILQDFFTDEYGCRFYDRQFPVGFAETERWLSDVGSFFGEDSIAQGIISKNRERYEAGIAQVRPRLAGKKLMLITYNHDIDWILSAALDAGMEIVKLCILNFSQDEGFRSAIPEVDSIPIEEDYDPSKRVDDIEHYQPDILLSNYESSVARGNCYADTIPMCPDVGFFSGLKILDKWASLFEMQSEGEWEHDQQLFVRYYSR